MIKKFRKKPVEVRAVLWDGTEESLEEIKKLGMENILSDCVSLWVRVYEKPILYFNTIENRTFSNVGDWIIKGIDGQLYPCKPEIFKKTYEEIK